MSFSNFIIHPLVPPQHLSSTQSDTVYTQHQSFPEFYRPIHIPTRPTENEMVKRSPSDSPSPSLSPPQTPKKKSKISSVQTSPSKSGNARTTPGEWNGEKKAALIDHLISVGLAHCKLDDLAVEFDLSKSQVGDATKKSRPNNLRQKVVACARSN